MARPANKLTARNVETEKRKGLHADGAGLYLRVTPTGSKNWVYRYRRSGELVDVGLGSVGVVGLRDARMRAAELRQQRHNGIDPRQARRDAKVRSLQHASLPTFGAVADRLIEDMRPGWKNAKHAAQWVSTLSAASLGTLRDMRVDEVETADVLKVISPMWHATPETAQRTLNRIEKVLDAAKARGFRTGDNPAVWRGNLQHQLSKKKKLIRGHHPAMPVADVPDFMGWITRSKDVAPQALEFTVLTAARSGETRGAKWGEIDLQQRVWTVPAGRMKGQKEHRVPLSYYALKLLSSIAGSGRPDKDALVFPGRFKGKPLSDMSLTAVLNRMNRGRYTVHGFRSTFRDWAGDHTTASREVTEAALAHRAGDNVELAYRRGDALDKRRHLMEAWGAYLYNVDEPNVLPFHGRA